MGIPALSEDEFEQQFVSVDFDKDGLINFDDFKDFIIRSSQEMDQSIRNSYVYVDGSGDDEGTFKQMLSAETISAINNLFEDFKVKQGDTKGAVVDLKDIRTSIEMSKQPEVPLTVFDGFFKQFLVISIEGDLEASFITEAQFAEIIQEYECYLIQSNGAYRISSTEHSVRPSDQD